MNDMQKIISDGFPASSHRYPNADILKGALLGSSKKCGKICVDSWHYAEHKNIFFRFFLPSIEPPQPLKVDWFCFISNSYFVVYIRNHITYT